MHIYFSGVGGTAIGPLALIAKQAGYEVSGSDAQDSSYIDYLRGHGIDDIHIGQTREQIGELHAKKPIDWFVYSSALPKTNPNHPELVFCQENNIKTSKRDELLNKVLSEKNLKLIAIAGTHGKTTVTAMAIWLFKQLNIPVSYSVGAKISFGDMGAYEPGSEFFIYEADEYDRNFLSFNSYLSIITGIDWDHPDIYPSKEEYHEAFRDFLGQSQWSMMWQSDCEKLGIPPAHNSTILSDNDERIQSFALAGEVNRKNAYLVATSAARITGRPLEEIIDYLNDFPGLSRRFEELTPGLYTDYAHTPPKIRGALQLAHEVAGDNVVVVYEGLHNTRQHFIKDDLPHLFDSVKRLYIVPSFLAREDTSLKLLSPADLKNLLSHDTQVRTDAAELDERLVHAVQNHLKNGDLVLALSAGSGGSLDEWLRKEFN